MSTAATGQFGKAHYNLESLVVAASAFREEIAPGTTEAAARDRVYWPGSPLPANTYPRALIRLREGMSLAYQHSGAGGGYPNFPLLILLERAAVKEDAPKERIIKFLNWVDAVIKGMNQVARTPGYLEVTEIAMANMMMSDPNEDECYDQATIELKVLG